MHTSAQPQTTTAPPKVTMASTVVITLIDTPTGDVAVHSTFTPAVGQRCTPAQAYAMDIICHHRQFNQAKAVLRNLPATQERGR